MKKKYFIDLGKRLKKARMALGIQQNEMAAVAGVNSAYISSLERGKRTNPGIAFLFKIANHFHISLDYLLLGVGDMFLPSKVDDEKIEKGFPADFSTIEDVARLMKSSNFAKNSILTYVVRFYIENEDFLKMEMMRARGKVQEGVQVAGGFEPLVAKTGDEGSDK